MRKEDPNQASRILFELCQQAEDAIFQEDYKDSPGQEDEESENEQEEVPEAEEGFYGDNEDHSYFGVDVNDEVHSPDF